MDRRPYDVGRAKQVFIDWGLIEPGYGVGWRDGRPCPWEMPYGVKIAVHRPRVDAQPLISSDRPWEGSINVYSTLLEEGGTYRLYYECYGRGRASEPGDSKAMLAYSESTDGLSWQKPTIGHVSFRGSKQNNLVYARDATLGRGASGASVFKDPSAPTDERYKLVHVGSEQGQPCVFGAVSPDGLRWRALEKPLIRGYKSDTQTVVLFDRGRGRYVGYFRGWERLGDGGWSGRRTIAYAETDRFENWPIPRTIVALDATDEPDVDIYTNAYVRWPRAANAHLMFPTLYRRGPDVMQVHLMVSRDGVDWQRPSREPLIPSGEPGSGWEGGVYAGRGLTSFNPGELALVIGPRWHTHNQARFPAERQGDLPSRGYLCCARWREDGFTSVEATTEGRCTTVPLSFAGHELTVNAWTRFGGEMRVGVVEALGPEMSDTRPVEGYTIDECDPISGDALKQTVTWNGRSDLKAWAGRPIRLRFLLRRARLHAFQFV